MPEYTNRKGDTYYLKESVSKKGRPRYYASTKPEDGANASSMPDGYEFFENVNGLVFVRKIPKRHLLDAEIGLLATALEKLKAGARYEEKGKQLVVHTPRIGMGSPGSSGFLTLPSETREQLLESAHYAPMLRFTLVDSKERLFETHRMCFMGEPDWLSVWPPRPLGDCVAKFIPLLDDIEMLFEHT